MHEARFACVSPLIMVAAYAVCSCASGSANNTAATSAASSSSATSGGAGGDGSSSTSSSGGSGGPGGSPGAGGAASSSVSTTGAGGSAACAACVVVATLPAGSAPYGLFADGTNVYWTNEGTGEVMQAATDGSNLLTLASGQDHPHAVQVSGGVVYWVLYSASGILQTTPVGGGPISDMGPAAAAVELAVGESLVFWTNNPDDIQSVPLTGLPDGGTPNLLTGNPLSNGVALDDTSIYWVNEQDGYVKKADYDLSNETPLANGDVPWGVAVDATHIYWTESGSSPGAGKVMTASKVDGSDSVQLAGSLMDPQGIAVDDTSVYWAGTGDGTINKVPLAGGPITVLAQGQSMPIKVAVDATYVYWTNNAGDTIVKVAK
jgi:hypothetical protein